jgi:hypothetical protein
MGQHHGKGADGHKVAIGDSLVIVVKVRRVRQDIRQRRARRQRTKVAHAGIEKKRIKPVVRLKRDITLGRNWNEGGAQKDEQSEKEGGSPTSYRRCTTGPTFCFAKAA